jgi:hypothetical protein
MKMTPKQVKAMQVAARIKKLIYSKFDDKDVFGGLRLLNRWSLAYLTAFPGERQWTPGEMLDSWIETRTFESRF